MEGSRSSEISKLQRILNLPGSMANRSAQHYKRRARSIEEEIRKSKTPKFAAPSRHRACNGKNYSPLLSMD
jgi:hypothetical protein